MLICEFFRTFAPDMKKIFLLIAFVAVSLVCAHAETIVLRTGARVIGTVVIMNDDVVIVRDASGARFQYPRAEVVEVIKEEEKEIVAEPQNNETEELEVEIKTRKKFSALLEISGGAAINPNEAYGAGVGVDLILGNHHIGNRHIMIGGGVGYHGMFVSGKTYNFLPIQVALRLPFFEAKHAPVFGASLGYGIALSKNYKGGIYAGIDFGYRYQFSPKTALAVVAFAQFQQAKINSTISVEGVDFVNQVGCNFFTPGVKLALYF